MKDPTAHQNVLFSFFGEASFESDTIFDENDRIRESACGGARQWQEDVDGLGVFDDGAVFLVRGGGAVGQWFLDNGLMQDFGILDMNGIRAAYRAVKTPPPFCFRCPPVLILPATDECEDFVQSAMMCLRLCASSLLIKLTSTDTDTHLALSQWPTRVYGVGTFTGIDERHIFIVNNHGNGDTVRERGRHLHTVVIPVNTTCSHCDQHFESVAILLEHLRTVFPLDRGNAELGLDAGVRNAGDEATENEAPSRRTGAAEPRHTEANAADSIPSGLETRSGDPRAAGGHLPLDGCEARRTFDADEQSGHGTFRDQIEGETAATGRAARLRMGGHDDGFDHGHSTLRTRQAESGGMHVQREFTGDSSAEHLLEPVQKKTEGLGQVAVFRGPPDSTHLVPHHQSQMFDDL